MRLFKNSVCFGLILSLIIIGAVCNLPAQAEMIDKAPTAHQVDIQQLQLDNHNGADGVDLAQMRAGDGSYFPLILFGIVIAGFLIGAVIASAL